MKRIGLISDTHGFLHPRVFSFFKDCDEIWHAGDIGDLEIIEKLSSYKPVKAIFGNIDDGNIRTEYPEFRIFEIEDVKVLLIHIGGYPGRYSKLASQLIKKHKPKLFISGHSHILKVIPDKKNNLLHINPGSGGNTGQHQVITFVRFVLDSGNITDLEVFESSR